MLTLEQLRDAWPMPWRQLTPRQFYTRWDDQHDLLLFVRGDYLRAVLERHEGLQRFRIARGLGTTVAEVRLTLAADAVQEISALHKLAAHCAA